MNQENLSPQVLFERGKDYFEHGDFLAARKDFNEVLAAHPGEDLEAKAKEMLMRIRVDPVEIIAGVAVLLLILGLFAYFGIGNS